MPTRRRPLSRSQSVAPSCSRIATRACLSRLRETAPEVGKYCSVTRTAPSGHDPDCRAWRPATEVSCRLPPPRSSTTPSASVVEFTAAMKPSRASSSADSTPIDRPVRSCATASRSAPFAASRIALVATASTASGATPRASR